MRFITRFSLKNTLFIFLVIAMLIGGGIYSSTGIGTELMPDISFPVVSIVTVYPGAAPDDIAGSISRPVQKAVSAIQGVKNVNAISNENMSIIMMQFDFSKDMEKAEREVNDAVSKIKMPDRAQKPMVSRLSYNAIPVVTYSVTSDKDENELAKLIKDKVQPALAGVKGVGSVDVNGIHNKNIYIKINEKKLKENNVSFESLQKALAANDISFPVGTVNIEEQTLPIRVSRKIYNMNDIKSIPIIVMPDASKLMGDNMGKMAETFKITTLALSDVATITLDSNQGLSYTRSQMKPTVILNIYKNQDANTVELASDIDAKVDELKGDVKGLEIKKISDTSGYITNSINGMVKEGLLGAIFAILVIAIFLRDLRATIIAVISIPLSIAIALILLPRTGITLNIMSLSGMAVAVGRIVDDSIVVIENVFRRLQKQRNEDGNVIEDATGEVSSAITSSTITTIAVFAPLAFVSGMVGKVFASFALTVVICIAASLLVAVTVVPVMSKFMLLKKPPKHSYKESKIENGYKKVLSFALSHRALIVILSIVLLAGSVMVVPLLGIQFLPAETTKVIDAKLKLTAGTSLDETNKEALKMEEFLINNKDIDIYTSTVGSPGEAAAAFGMTQGSNQASLSIILKDKAEPEKVLKLLQEKAKSLQSDKVSWTVVPQGSFGGQESLEVVVNGENIEDIKAASDVINKKLNEVKGLSNISNNLSEKKPEISVKVDSQKAAQKGLSPDVVMMIIGGALNYNKVTTVENEGRSVDVMIGFEKEALNSLDKIQNLELMPGTVVKDIAEVKLQDGPVNISERDGKRFASIRADVTSGDTAKTAKELTAKLKEVETQLKPGVTYRVGGSVDDINEVFKQMGIAMLVAIFLVFLTMLITFKEGTAPLAIMFSLPFAATGALFALLIVGRPLSMSGLVGLLMLIGIVVTNAIVLIDRVQRNRGKGMDIRESLIEAGAVRLRPIMMTAAATVMALIPLALGFSEGAIISEELGVVVIGGLTFSTLLTLVIVPVAYSILEGLKERILGKKEVVDVERMNTLNRLQETME